MKKEGVLMLVALIILGIITVVALVIIIKMAKVINDLMEEMVIQPELYPCELLLMVKYNQEQESVVTDFSRYDEYKQVGLIIQKKGPPSTAEEGLIDGKLCVRPHSAVYKVGEQWLWKFG